MPCAWMARSLAAAVTSLALAAAPARVGARTLVVPAGDGALASAMTEAASGDTLRLLRGVHAGPVRLTTSVTLRGEPGAVIDGGGRGSVVFIEAPGVVLEDL